MKKANSKMKLASLDELFTTQEQRDNIDKEYIEYIHIMAIRPAVEISYISKANQKLLYKNFEYNNVKPTLSQAQLLRKLDNEAQLTKE